MLQGQSKVAVHGKKWGYHAAHINILICTSISEKLFCILDGCMDCIEHNQRTRCFSVVVVLFQYVVNASYLSYLCDSCLLSGEESPNLLWG